MIAFVRGEVASVGVDTVVVDVGGVGYAVHCAPATLAALVPGEQVRVPTSMVVREDSMTMYGFADDDERVVFELLQTASGVGPRLALAMLAALPPDDLRRAVCAEDWAALTAVPGIGKKGAQRIVLELRDRLGAPVRRIGEASTRPVLDAVGAEPWREQVTAALLGLGWSAREAEDAVTSVAGTLAEPGTQEPVRAAAGTPPDVAALLRAALRTLNRTESRA